MSEMVTVVGAGLAGCEAAWQLAQRGISVRLCEMKPVQHTPAYQYKCVLVGSAFLGIIFLSISPLGRFRRAGVLQLAALG